MHVTQQYMHPGAGALGGAALPPHLLGLSLAPANGGGTPFSLQHAAGQGLAQQLGLSAQQQQQQQYMNSSSAESVATLTAVAEPAVAVALGPAAGHLLLSDVQELFMRQQLGGSMGDNNAMEVALRDVGASHLDGEPWFCGPGCPGVLACARPLPWLAWPQTLHPCPSMPVASMRPRRDSKYWCAALRALAHV
jgi:hypothetical protein